VDRALDGGRAHEVGAGGSGTQAGLTTAAPEERHLQVGHGADHAAAPGRMGQKAW
jgi:hypothetical protein